MRGTKWSLEDAKLAFYLYCQLPFGKLHTRNPDIIRLAEFLGRSPGAVAMKLCNFASLDPGIINTGRHGLGNVAQADRTAWDAFHSNWTAETAACEARLANEPEGLGRVVEAVLDHGASYDREDYSGESRDAVVRQRVGQRFFRNAVLGVYEGRCCMSGLSNPRLLVASHIVPWALDEQNRLNPRNGLCLSAIHDRAFDQHLLSLSADMEVLVSQDLKKQRDLPLVESAFLSIEGKRIELPKRFQPDVTFLAAHRERFEARD